MISWSNNYIVFDVASWIETDMTQYRCFKWFKWAIYLRRKIKSLFYWISLCVFLSLSGTPSKRNFVRVVINVQDHNDHKPVFLSDIFEGKVLETAAIGTNVVQVIATDKDKGKRYISPDWLQWHNEYGTWLFIWFGHISRWPSCLNTKISYKKNKKW